MAWGTCGDCGHITNVQTLTSRNIAGHPVEQPYPMCEPCRRMERQCLQLSGHTNIRAKGDT